MSDSEPEFTYTFTLTYPNYTGACPFKVGDEVVSPVSDVYKTVSFWGRAIVIRIETTLNPWGGSSETTVTVMVLSYFEARFVS